MAASNPVDAEMAPIDPDATTRESVIVADNFFNSALTQIIGKSTEEFRWRYWRPVTDDKNHNKTFVSILWDEGAEQNLFYMLWTVIKNHFNDLEQCYCYRIIANGTIKGQNIGWHRDNGYKTVLYYPNEWKAEWGGSTYFKFDNSEKEIRYVQNRLIIFNTNLLHYSATPKVDNVLRISIAFNWRLEA